MMGRNEIVATRIRQGTLRALSLLVSRYTPILLRGIGLCLIGLITLPFDTARGNKKCKVGRDTIARALAAVEGLWRPGYNRPLAKTGRLIHVADITSGKS